MSGDGSNPAGVSAMIAAIPSLIGYRPQDAVVTVLMRGTVAVAWTVCGADDPGTDAAATVTAVRRHAPTFYASVIIGPRYGNARRVADLIGEVLTGIGIERAGLWHTRQIAAGQEWVNLHTGQVGVIDDPAVSPVAASAVVDGRVIADSLGEFEARYRALSAPADLRHGVAEAERLGSEFVAATLHGVFRVVTGADAPGSRLASTLAHLVTVGPQSARDAVLASATIDPGAAHWVLTDLAARLRGAARAEVLTMAALAAFCDGYAMGAHSALSAATAALHDTGEPMLTPRWRVVSRAVRTGQLSTDVARALALAGIDAAAEYGVIIDML